MRSTNVPKAIRKSFVFLGGLFLGELLLSGLCAAGQETPSASSSTAAAPQTADLRALTQSIADLQAQMKSMSAQMEEMQKEQARSHEEAQELRHKLEEAQQNLSAASNSNGGYAPATKATQAPPSTSATPRESPATATEQSGGDRLAAIEETQQLQDSKINDIYQTKIESGSKYRLRLSGIVLLPTDGNPAGSPVDLLIRDGRIAAITPAAAPPARRLLATPALVNDIAPTFTQTDPLKMGKRRRTRRCAALFVCRVSLGPKAQLKRRLSLTGSGASWCCTSGEPPGKCRAQSRRRP